MYNFCYKFVSTNVSPNKLYGHVDDMRIPHWLTLHVRELLIVDCVFT